MTLFQCGSFLQRGATKLARLASLIKERNDGSQSAAATVNASGNFVFHSLTAEEAAKQRDSATSSSKSTKRQASDVGENKRPAKKAKIVSNMLGKKTKSLKLKHIFNIFNTFSVKDWGSHVILFSVYINLKGEDLA